MADITNDELESMLADVHHHRYVEVFPYEIVAMVEEILRHRFTIQRLEEWAEWLDHTGSLYNAPIAAELRKRMKGD